MRVMDAKKEIDALNIYPNKSSKIDVLTPHKIIVVSIRIANHSEITLCLRLHLLHSLGIFGSRVLEPEIEIERCHQPGHCISG